MLRSFCRTLALLAAVAAFSPSAPAVAADDQSSATIGLGFRTLDAPIGARWWITSMFGVDAGFGFSSEKAIGVDSNLEDVEGTLVGWTIDVGAPICLRQWQRVHCIARPGFLYRSEDDLETFTTGFGAVGKRTLWTAELDLEVEVFLVANLSFSASYGIGYTKETLKTDDENDGTFDSEVDLTNVFHTRGNNVTELGFHIYLW